MFNNSLEKNRYSLRKLSVGLASVLIGISFIEANGQTAKADTVDGTNTAAISTKVEKTTNASDANKGTTASNGSLDAAGSANAGQESVKENGSQNYNANDSAKATTAKTEAVKGTITNAKAVLDAEAGTQKANTPVTNHLKLVVQPKASVASNEVKPNTTDSATLIVVKPQETKFTKQADVKALTESKVATDNQFNFDDWTTQIDNTYLNITGYNGDRSKQIVVPNGADFAKAGKNDQNLQVEIDKGTLAGLIVNGVAPKLSNTDGQKIVAEGNDWSEAFFNKNLHDISGLANLDTSNITNMRNMFEYNQINDLSPLVNWNTGNVTGMNGLFESNQISDLSPLASWNTDKVTGMNHMFMENQISDLSPLANWNTGNVTGMGSMFRYNRISDLSPLANWKTGNVTNMNVMFDGNQISDLSPLTSWNTGNVTNMSYMFRDNQISDLSPLSNWNTDKVTAMDEMFKENQIGDLSPLASWKTGNVTDMYGIFYGNQISDLSPLTNWNTSNVTDMNHMFSENQISDLSPLANWNTGNVTDMSWMFDNNEISDLSPLTSWKTGKVTDMSWMFANNPDLIDLSPIANWNLSSVTNDYSLFSSDTKLNLTNINDTPLMKVFLKEPNALSSAIFITNNADLVKATINKDLPNLTNTAKRTITFNIPNATPKTIVQTINYKAVAKLVQVDFDNKQIVKTYPVKASDWQLDTSKQNDDVIIDGTICFKPVPIPHIPGYKAIWSPAKDSSDNSAQAASYSISFMALPNTSDAAKDDNTEINNPTKPVVPSDDTKPSINVPVTPNDHKDTVPKSPIAAPNVPVEVEDTQDITFDKPVEVPAVQATADPAWHIKDDAKVATYTVANAAHTLSLPKFNGYTLRLVKRNAARDAISFVYVNPDKTLKYIFNIKLANGKYILTIGKVTEDGIIQLEKVTFSDYKQLIALIAKAVNR